MIATQDTLNHPRQESRTTTSGWWSTTGWSSAPAGTTSSRGANLARASRSSSSNEKAPHRWIGVRRERQPPSRATPQRRTALALTPCWQAQHMTISERHLLDALNRTPFVDSTELALILGEPHATIHRTLADLLADGITGRVSHGTAHLPSSQRYYLTTKGIRQATRVLGFETPSDFVRAYPVSREWLTLLIRRMDAVASVYRLAASLSPGIVGLRSRVEFHRRGRFDAIITLHDGRSFGVVRHGLALRGRSLCDRLRDIADATPGPGAAPTALCPRTPEARSPGSVPR